MLRRIQSKSGVITAEKTPERIVVETKGLRTLDKVTKEIR
nr:hypothetical protein [uncultured archaeon]